MSDIKLERSEINVLSKALEWHEKGRRVCIVSVIKTWGSSPRPVGAMMSINSDGLSIGSVSGGCIEDELLTKIVNNFPKISSLLSFSSEEHRSLPCGGHVDLLVEPITDSNEWYELLSRLKSFKNIFRLIDKENPNNCELKEVNINRDNLKEKIVINYPPPWRLLIIGSGDLSLSVFKISSLMGYNVSICDPRKEFTESWIGSNILIHRMMPDDFIIKQNCDSKTAIVALTHDPKIDDLAMIEALKTKAFYIGALGSIRTANARRKRLIEHFDFTEHEVDKIKAPIGIDFATKKVNEIALSVMAEITIVKNGVSVSTNRIERKQLDN